MKRFFDRLNAFGESDVFTAATALAFLIGSAAYFIARSFGWNP